MCVKRISRRAEAGLHHTQLESYCRPEGHVCLDPRWKKHKQESKALPCVDRLPAPLVDLSIFCPAFLWACVGLCRSRGCRLSRRPLLCISEAFTAFIVPTSLPAGWHLFKGHLPAERRKTDTMKACAVCMSQSKLLSATFKEPELTEFKQAWNTFASFHLSGERPRWCQELDCSHALV